MSCRIAANDSTDCSADADSAPETSSSAGRDEEGFILIAVIWIVLFLALAIGSFSLAIRAHVQDASAHAGNAEARALADAGALLALHDLFNAHAARAWKRRHPADGRRRGCSVGSGHIVVTVEDEAGKVDLNAGSEELLRALLIGLAQPPIAADRIVAAILDYRDTDGLTRLGGAEAAEYLQAGRLTVPKNAPFDATVELSQVLGLEPKLIEQLRASITVHSGLAGIDPSKASADLVAAIAAGAANSATLLDRETVSSEGTRLPAALVAPSSRRVFSIKAEAKGWQGATFTREMTVRIAPSRSQPYAVLAWRQGNTLQQRPEIDLGAC